MNAQSRFWIPVCSSRSDDDEVGGRTSSTPYRNRLSSKLTFQVYKPQWDTSTTADRIVVSFWQ
jgi:hypothetical protein